MQKRKDPVRRIALRRSVWIQVLRALDDAKRAPCPDGWRTSEWAMQCGDYAMARSVILALLAEQDAKVGAR